MKMILMGIFLGFGLVVPGVSCTASAIIYNVYDDYLELLKKFYNIKIIKKHFKLLIGLLIGVLLTIVFLDKVYNRIPILINSIFMFLMIKGLIKVIKENSNLKYNLVNLIKIFLGIMFILLVKVIFTNIQIENNHNFSYLIITGFITSLSFIIPGLSGGMILISFGMYFYFIDIINQMLNNFPYINFNYFMVILVFSISVFIGIIINSKVIKIKRINNFLLGLLIGSLLLMLSEHLLFLTNYIDYLKYFFTIFLLFIFMKN